ncbi:MAG TPA: 6-phospho-beta-glucosidase [Naasia sp.]|jgi:6-phospho-beta-glucosidase
MKIAVIGGGSTYTPELVSGLDRQRERLPVDELWLMDPDLPRLEVVGGMARRMLARQGSDVAVTLTDDRSAALDGADAVLVQLRVGGQAARLRDETFPLQCDCIGQETTGAGGLAKALRTVPVVLDIAEEAAGRAAAGHHFIDFTNPVGINTRALLDAGHSAIGLCNVAIGVQRWIAAQHEVDPWRVEVDQVGLNHLTWVRAIRVDGVDVLPGMIEREPETLARRAGVTPDLIRELGALPSYYLSYYYEHDAAVARMKTERPRAEVVAETEAELLEIYRDESVDEKPAALDRRGGAWYSEAATALLASLVEGTGDTHVVNVRNRGTIGGLADDDVIEVLCRIDSNGATPLPQPPLAPELLGLLQHVTAYERLAIAAAVSGDRSLVRKALLAHPLVGQWTLAKRLEELLLESGADHLPRFAGDGGKARA